MRTREGAAVWSGDASTLPGGCRPARAAGSGRYGEEGWVRVTDHPSSISEDTLNRSKGGTFGNIERTYAEKSSPRLLTCPTPSSRKRGFLARNGVGHRENRSCRGSRLMTRSGWRQTRTLCSCMYGRSAEVLRVTCLVGRVSELCPENVSLRQCVSAVDLQTRTILNPKFQRDLFTSQRRPDNHHEQL